MGLDNNALLHLNCLFFCLQVGNSLDSISQLSSLGSLTIDRLEEHLGWLRACFASIGMVSGGGGEGLADSAEKIRASALVAYLVP